MIGKAILWGVIGAIAGGCLGGLAGIVGSIIVGLGIGIAAFVSSYRNEGRPPKWLWRSKIKQDGKGGSDNGDLYESFCQFRT